MEILSCHKIGFMLSYSNLVVFYPMCHFFCGTVYGVICSFSNQVCEVLRERPYCLVSSVDLGINFSTRRCVCVLSQNKASSERVDQILGRLKDKLGQ